MGANLRQIAPCQETDKSACSAIDDRHASNVECSHPICERTSEFIGIPDEYLRAVGTLNERVDARPTVA